LDAARRAALARAKQRLDRLPLYPEPVRVDRVRVVVAPQLFRLPWLRRFDGYAAWGLVLLRSGGAGATADDDLLVHELCHVWQLQHRPLAMPLSYLRSGYARNPYEAEARAAVEATRGPAPDRPAAAS
jgi:hypothetical protein